MSRAGLQGSRAKVTTNKDAPAAVTKELADPVSRNGSEGEAVRKSSKARGKQRELDSGVATEGDGADEGDDPQVQTGEDPQIDLEKISKKCHHALRQLSSTVKKSRQFETQRLIKRLKAPGCRAEETQKLEAELAALKTLSTTVIAAHALLGKLGKAKLLPRGPTSNEFRTKEAEDQQKGLADYPLLAAVWQEAPLKSAWIQVADEVDPSDEGVKAKARLLSHKLLAEECARFVDELGRLAGKVRPDRGVAVAQAVAQSGSSSAPAVKEQSADLARSEEEQDREWSGSEDDEDESVEDASDRETSSVGTGDNSDGDLSDQSEAGEVDEEEIQRQMKSLGDLDQWDALVASSSGDEGDSVQGSSSEKGTSSGEDRQNRETGSQAKSSKRKRSPVQAALPVSKKHKDSARADSKRSDSDDDDEGTMSSDSEDEGSDDGRANLPALTHGFLPHSFRSREDEFSGGESDDESDFDFDEDAEDGAGAKVKGSKSGSASKDRKNRMGQRARKA